MTYFRNSTSAISQCKYIMQYSRGKPIDIKASFIHDLVENGDFVFKFVDFENQLTNIITNPLLEDIFCLL